VIRFETGKPRDGMTYRSCVRVLRGLVVREVFLRPPRELASESDARTPVARAVRALFGWVQPWR
jgi:hypothetical protein